MRRLAERLTERLIETRRDSAYKFAARLVAAVLAGSTIVSCGRRLNTHTDSSTVDASAVDVFIFASSRFAPTLLFRFYFLSSTFAATSFLLLFYFLSSLLLSYFSLSRLSLAHRHSLCTVDCCRPPQMYKCKPANFAVYFFRFHMGLLIGYS